MVVDNIDIVWSKTLEGTAHVDTLVTERYIYAGSNGYVYRIDRDKGTELARQDLPGFGHNRVSIAMSPDNILIITTEGKLAALDPITLQITWSKSIPELTTPIHLLLTQDYICAGSAGVVCSSGYDGACTPVVKKISEKGAETRLVMLENNCIVAATAGLLTSLVMPVAQVKWTQQLDKVSGVTSVIYKGMDLYAGGDGYVYSLDSSSGGVVRSADVGASTQGYKEVNLSLEPDCNRLYVATNGFGVSLDSFWLDQKYAVSFPKSGNHVTSVSSVQDTAIFGSQGRVFQLDEDGSIVGRNDMPGYGDTDTSVALLLPDRLLTCPDGYVTLMKLDVVPEVTVFDDY